MSAEIGRKFIASPAVVALCRSADADAVRDVDVFGGALAGLILAEIAPDPEDRPAVPPPRSERAVAADPRYRDCRLPAGARPEPPAARACGA